MRIKLPQQPRDGVLNMGTGHVNSPSYNIQGRGFCERSGRHGTMLLSGVVCVGRALVNCLPAPVRVAIVRRPLCISCPIL